MPEKDPQSYSWIAYAWVIVLSTWGGLVGFISKVKAGSARPWNIMELVGELVTSAFAGVLTFWACEAANIGGLYTAMLVGISGHMGSRAIFQMEQWASRKWGVLTK